MDKAKFIFFVICGVALAYIVITILMPVITSTSGAAVTTVNASPNASSYQSSIAGMQYTPLVLYFVPAIIGIAAIVWKLKKE